MKKLTIKEFLKKLKDKYGDILIIKYWSTILYRTYKNNSKYTMNDVYEAVEELISKDELI